MLIYNTLNHKLIFVSLFLVFGTSAIQSDLSLNLCKPYINLLKNRKVYLYAGDISSDHPAYHTAIGLSLHKSDSKHIKQDITKTLPFPDNSVDIFQAEDVYEHIEYAKIISVINEVYRILKPGGLLRISVPDYRCDVLYKRSWKDKKGNIIFDPYGGGTFVNGKVLGGGHVWFPIYENVKSLLDKTMFSKKGSFEFLHYYNPKGQSITKSIDYSKGYIKRTPDHDKRVQTPYRVMSLVVDLIKESL